MKLGEDGSVELDGDTPDEAIKKCLLCDVDGYRLPTRSTVCDHVDRRQTAAEGIAKVRAAMSKEKGPGE